MKTLQEVPEHATRALFAYLRPIQEWGESNSQVIPTYGTWLKNEKATCYKMMVIFSLGVINMPPWAYVLIVLGPDGQLPTHFH
jgi:hypothetical protein